MSAIRASKERRAKSCSSRVPRRGVPDTAKRRSSGMPVYRPGPAGQGKNGESGEGKGKGTGNRGTARSRDGAMEERSRRAGGLSLFDIRRSVFLQRPLEEPHAERGLIRAAPARKRFEPGNPAGTTASSRSRLGTSDPYGRGSDRRSDRRGSDRPVRDSHPAPRFAQGVSLPVGRFFSAPRAGIVS